MDSSMVNKDSGLGPATYEASTGLTATRAATPKVSQGLGLAAAADLAAPQAPQPGMDALETSSITVAYLPT